MEEKVFITNRNGLKMAIKLNVSSDRTKLVFLEHGLSARKEYPHMKVMEDIFAQFGYNVVNIDATNSLNESEISGVGITFTSHYQDLQDAINWAKTQSFYVEPFAIAGQSLGAASGINFAGNYPDKVNLLLAAASPFIKGQDLMEKDEMMKHVEQYGYFDKVSKSVGRTLRINKIFNDDIKQYDLAKAIKNIKADTYIIQGDLDVAHIKEVSSQIYNMLDTKKHFILLENTPHDLANTEQTKSLFTNTMIDILKSVHEKN